MKYVILNDGETYSNIDGCVIYDSEENKCYSIVEGDEVNIEDHEKGIDNINNDVGETKDIYREEVKHYNTDEIEKNYDILG